MLLRKVNIAKDKLQALRCTVTVLTELLFSRTIDQVEAERLLHLAAEIAYPIKDTPLKGVSPRRSESRHELYKTLFVERGRRMIYFGLVEKR